MDEKEIIIASLRRQLNELHSKCNATEQENALLNEEIDQLKRRLKNISGKG